MLSEQKMKNLIAKKARETGIAPQQLYGLFAMEQVLIKLADSPYKNHCIMKGGYVLSTRFGLDNRSTRDLDTTIRDMALNKDKINELVDYITSPDENGETHFKKITIKESRDTFEYNGFKVVLSFQNGKARFPIHIDFTTGEDLIDVDEESQIPLLFEEDKTVVFPSYPVEQILADKLYTTLAYGAIDDSNSRMKDYYDIYLLNKTLKDINFLKVIEAMNKTMTQRDNFIEMERYFEIINDLRKSDKQEHFWERFQQDQVYASGITFTEVMESVHSFVQTVVNHSVE